MPGPARFLRSPALAGFARWLLAGGLALELAACMAGDGPGSPPIASQDATPASTVLELRRGDRPIRPGGHDVAAATKPDGPREQDFSYTLTNRSAQPVRLLPLAVTRAINCRVTSTLAPAKDTLAPGDALNLTVRIAPRDRGPWRASLAIGCRDQNGAPLPAFTWDIAAPGP